MRFSLLLAVLLAPALVGAQTPQALPIGTAGAGSLGTGGEPSRFRFVAPGAGVLTVAVHGAADLVIAVTDTDGQPLANGMADVDFGGALGAEYLAVGLTEGGEYRIEVRSHDREAGSRFTITGSFLSVPAFARAPDPDGRPSQAHALSIGATHVDQLHPDSADRWDWFRVEVPEAMTLVVVTRMDEDTDGDLELELFRGGDFGESVARSDQDLQGNLGNESVTVMVSARETVHIRVRSVRQSGGPVPYRISVMRAP